MNNNIVPKSFTHDPFKELFFQFLESFDTDGIPAKTQAIQTFLRELDELENNTENESTFLHWSGIFSVFSSAGVLSGLTVLNPVLSIIAAGTAAASAIGVISLAIAQNQERKPIIEKLRRYRIALNSDQAINWACLWEYARTDIFLGSLYQASAGYLGDNRTLIRNDGKNPMAAALDSCCQYYGITRDELIAQLQQMKRGVKVNIPVVPKAIAQATTLQSSPTVLQQPISDRFYQNALNILGALVENADKSKLGGCVILAAPGAGKTTFLGAAWGRLKSQFGNNFKSLAVVVKPTDVKAFQACSDQAICVKDSAVNAAIAIIRFIREGVKHDGCVKRLFLDDFLTMNQYFQMSLKGKFVNPSTLSVYLDSKEYKTAEDYDAVPLIDCLFTSLNDAWLVGREYNLALYVSSHSPNVEALPFVGSRDSRSVGDLIFLAKNDKREFIDQALNNPNLIADNAKRQQLKDGLTSQSAQNDEPWVLANYGNWTLGIVPDDVYNEYQAYRTEWDNAQPIEKVRSQLENTFKSATTQATVTRKQAEVMIMALETTKSTTIEEFISNDLASPPKIEELKQAIRNTLQQANRQDLLRKFF